LIEAVMLWNEPNNLSHWDFGLDKDWSLFAGMVRQASSAIRAENSRLNQVLGGISPIDPMFIRRMSAFGVVDAMDAVAVHGFPLDWNHWMIDEWPRKLADIQAVTDKPIWVSEVGASSFGADEVQDFGLERTAEILIPLVEHIHWYSLYDLPKAWPATTRHREAEGSAYYRHFYMGLVREDAQAKRALKRFAQLTPRLGICQWLHFEDHRLMPMIQLLRDLGVKKLRTGLSWADFGRPNALAWYDKQMAALESFDVTLTFCFTPEDKGIVPHHTSPPAEPREFADFCASMVRRYIC
jgi:beta-xylosidase